MLTPQIAAEAVRARRKRMRRRTLGASLSSYIVAEAHAAHGGGLAVLDDGTSGFAALYENLLPCTVGSTEVPACRRCLSKAPA